VRAQHQGGTGSEAEQARRTQAQAEGGEMSDVRRADRRDENEREYVDLWRGLGYLWIPAKPGQGYDGILVTPIDIFIVEVKNGARKWKLTESEQRVKDEVERLGHEYCIVEDLEDAEILAGVIG